MMLVDKLSPGQHMHGGAATTAEWPSIQRRMTALSAHAPSSQVMPSSSSSSSPSPSSSPSNILYTPKIKYEYNEESQHHIITVPPFLSNDDGAYPSPLHHIHVLPLLTNEESTHLLQLARTYATENQCWDQQDATRHVSYPTVDFAIEDSIDIEQYLGDGDDGIGFQQRIFGALSSTYDVDAEDMSYLDLFCASYKAKDEVDATTNSKEETSTTMDRLDLHRDGSLLSFTVLLSPLEHFEGGGTIFDALQNINDESINSILQPQGVIQPPQAGYATLHSGKLLHGGHILTKGQRIVLVGFVDVDQRNMKPGALGEATKQWGRNDVRTYWSERRLSLIKQQQKSNIENEQLKNWRYLPKHTRSYFGKGSTIPSSILANIERRASLDEIRRRRLQTEDKLLREILLPREERGDKVDEGEWLEVGLDGMDGVLIG